MRTAIWAFLAILAEGAGGTDPRSGVTVEGPSDTAPGARAIRVELADSVIHGFEIPNPGKPVKLLLHGANLSFRQYWSLVEELRRDYHLLAVNFRGHGKGAERSFARIGDSPGSHDFATILVEDMEPLVRVLQSHVSGDGSTRKIGLIGYSMGGELALMYAGGGERAPDGTVRFSSEAAVLRATEILDGIVVLDASLGMEGDRGFYSRSTRAWFALADAVFSRLPGEVARVPMPRYPKEFAPVAGRAIRAAMRVAPSMFVLDPSSLAPDEWDQLFRVAFTPEVRWDIWGMAERSFRRGAITSRSGVDLSGLVEQIRVPTLLVMSEGMGALPAAVEGLRRIPAATPLQLHLMEGAGHIEVAIGRRAARLLAPLVRRFHADPTGRPSVAPPMRLVAWTDSDGARRLERQPALCRARLREELIVR